MILKTFAVTNKGFVRRENEDRYLVKEIREGFILLAVADGMGGEAAGEYAAEMIINKLCGLSRNSKAIEQQLYQLVKDVDHAIIEEARLKPEMEGMGSTITCTLIEDGILHWVHVGDSRLYIKSNRELIQVTKDQNMAQFLVEEGRLSIHEASRHPSQNMLDQCVGCGDCQPAAGHLVINNRDLVLLTTDGLHGEVSFENINDILARSTDIETKANSLVRAALDSGGRDNITVVIAEI
jgi:protein phosphatase